MKNRLTKFFTVFLAVVLCIGMAPATGSTAYAASRWSGSSISSWFSGLFGGSSDKTESNDQVQEDTSEAGSNSVSNETGDTTSEESTLNLTKTITHNEGDNYTIKLEAYSTGEVKTSVDTKDVPTDIVLVLDQSGSMDDEMYSYDKVYNLNTNSTYYIQVGGSWKSVSYFDGFMGFEFGKGWYCDGTHVTPKDSAADTSSNRVQFYTRKSTGTTRLAALKTAVNTFVSQIQEKAAASDATYRVAIVGFAMGESNNKNYSDYENTELFIGSNQYTYGSNNATNNYKNAFQDMKTEVGKNNITNSINALAARGATRADLGMEMANKIFAANPISEGEQRNHVVVMFTDGEPNDGNGFESNIATDTIYNSNVSKNTYGASVYTLGVLEGADPTQSIENASDINKYMHYVSSNFPKATSLNDGGTGGSISSGYYKKADDAAELESVFKQISNNIESGSTTITLNSESVLRDVISDDFSLPEGAKTSNIVVKTADYNGEVNGEKTWANPVAFDNPKVEIDGKTINVSNFDYSTLYAATVNGTNQGKKLIVEIPVKINRSFGGNNVLSNASAGIYATKDTAEPTVTARSPKGDHPTDYAVKGTKQWIDAGQSVTLESLIDYATDGDFKYQPDGVKNKYVDIVYTITDKNGKVVGTYTVKAGNKAGTYSTKNTPTLDVDTEYTVTCTVTPTSKATQDAIDEKRNATVETYTTKSYVYIKNPDKAFVIDFAKPITYTKDQVFNKNQLVNESAISLKKSTNTYGILSLNKDKSITYSLNKFMDGIDTYVFKVGCKADTQTVKMVPASSVYYEDNFGEETDAEGNVTTKSIIDYDGNWATVKDGNVVTSINGDDPVGYDSAYEGNTKFSSGSARMAKATTKTIKATFKFTGSGIDLYGYTDNNTGRMRIQLYKLDKKDQRISTKAAYTAIVDTKYNSGRVYQTPLFSYKGDKSERYEVVVTVGKGSTIYLDALRVYYPIGKTNENYTNDENNIEYVDIRDQIFTPEYFSVSGTLFVDKHANGHDTVEAKTINLSDAAGKAEYSTYGRKREVAIAPGGTVTLSRFKDGISVKQIGMRTNAVAPEKFQLTNPKDTVDINGKEINLTSATDMYYNVTVNKNGELVITNNTNYIITLTNLKLK